MEPAPNPPSPDTGLDPTRYHPDGCGVATIMLNLIEHGTWEAYELTDSLDTLVLSSRGIPPAAVAEVITQTSEILRTAEYVRSTKKRAAKALLDSRPIEQRVVAS